MATMIPNANCWIGFSPTLPAAVTLIPKLAEITAAVDLTEYVISLTASMTGNTVPVPALDSRFERTIPGTLTAQFSAEMYREAITAQDLAFTNLPIDQNGVFYISRFGGLGVDKRPITADKVDVWVVKVSAATDSPISSNTAATFSLTCSVPQPPKIGAVVTAT